MGTKKEKGTLGCWVSRNQGSSGLQGSEQGGEEGRLPLKGIQGPMFPLKGIGAFFREFQASFGVGFRGYFEGFSPYFPSLGGAQSALDP